MTVAEQLAEEIYEIGEWLWSHPEAYKPFRPADYPKAGNHDYSEA